MRLVEISYKEYCALAEAGAWVNCDILPYDDDSTLLRQAAMKHYVNRAPQFASYDGCKFYTRVECDG